jgi:hypothetical protein
MTDPVAFAEARLAEDKAAAVAASAAGPDWHHSYAVTADGPTTIVFAGPDDGVEIADTLRLHDEEIAPFIALHDPARTLREVEAGWRILARHDRSDDGACAVCSDPGSPRPCQDLADLLVRWADHPDYEPAWLPG